MTVESTQPCPHCGRPHDIGRRLHSDRVWCMYCNHWFAVVMRTNGTVYLAKCAAPEPGYRRT